MLARYIETLKYTLNAYVLDQQNGTNVETLYNSQYFEDLYIMEFRFIKNAFRSFITALTNMVNSSYTSLANTRMAAFVVFIIGLVMSYLILWTPFVNRLNNEVKLCFLKCIDMAH